MAISNNSTGLRPGVCTSTTRPTAPYEGQHIYETDTDIVYLWSGSAWVETVSALTKAPRGVVFQNKRTAGGTTVTTSVTDIAGATHSFTPVVGRAYRVSFSANVSNSGNVSRFFLNDSTLGNLYSGLMTFSGYQFQTLVYIVTGLTAVSRTLKITGQTESGTTTVLGSAGEPASFIIEDIGPA
jgi:hypothetical protein